MIAVDLLSMTIYKNKKKGKKKNIIIICHIKKQLGVQMDYSQYALILSLFVAMLRQAQCNKI